MARSSVFLSGYHRCFAKPGLTLGYSSITIDDWLLTEAVRIQEESGGRRNDDEAANRIARNLDGQPPARLMARAGALPGAAEARADIARIRKLLARCFTAIVTIGAVGGLVAARSVAAGREIDFLLTGLVLVGLPTLMLAVWVLVLATTARRPITPSVSGHLAISGSQRLAGLLLTSPLRAELIRAASRLLAGPLGRWHLSALSHALWLAYALGAWLGLVVLFSLVQYELSWGTTLLDENQVVELITALGTPIHALGFMPAPAMEWIAAGREGVDLGSMRADWARFLLGMVLVYAALPRLLLLMLCVFLSRRAAHGLQLDARAPGYQRVLPLIRPDRPDGERLGAEPPPDEARPLRQLGAGAGRPGLLGLELGQDVGSWPPKLGELAVDDLGQVERREQFQTLSAALAAMRDKPRALMAVCSLKRTPDSGTAQRLNQLADAAAGALILILTDQDQLSARGVDPETRLQDWNLLARRCGAHFLVMDLNQPQSTAVAQLKTWLEEKP